MLSEPKREMSGWEDVSSSDDRREWLRINDRVFLEYHLIGEASPSNDAAREDMISMFIAKPTEDLLARIHKGEGDSVLVPWLMKIDWVLELMLRSLLRRDPEGMAIPRLTEVSLSGGGICFAMTECVGVGDQVDLRLILPPFTPIKARAEVIRVGTMDGDTRTHAVATHFIDISSDDREHLIHHILHLQAERLRTRHSDLV
ncbi:MAG: PilZ domain-containing protein [Nitrospiraceae bacterium]